MTVVLLQLIENDRYSLEVGRSFFDVLMYEAICKPRLTAVTVRVRIAITVLTSIIVTTSWR